MLVLVGAVLSRVIMVPRMGINVRVGLSGMPMQMRMQVLMVMLMGMNFIAMLMLMGVGVDMLMDMQVFVFRNVFHGGLLARKISLGCVISQSPKPCQPRPARRLPGNTPESLLDAACNGKGMSFIIVNLYVSFSPGARRKPVAWG